MVVKPQAHKAAFLSIDEAGCWHIALRAKPIQGAANKALIAYLAELLDLPKSSIHLQKGEQTRYKRISLPLTERVQEFLLGQKRLL